MENNIHYDSDSDDSFKTPDYVPPSQTLEGSFTYQVIYEGKQSLI